MRGPHGPSGRTQPTREQNIYALERARGQATAADGATQAHTLGKRLAVGRRRGGWPSPPDRMNPMWRKSRELHVALLRAARGEPGRDLHQGVFLALPG